MVAPSEVLWIGGAQWSGKSSVANVLAARYPLLRYVYDYHDARSHAQRARSDPDRFPRLSAFLVALDVDPDLVWVRPSPAEMVDTARQIFAEKFEMVIKDLDAMPTGARVLAEGWGLRPELVAQHVTTPDQAVILVPTDEFRQRQLESVERTRRVSASVSDPELAQANRLERDRLLGQEVVDNARRLGLTVIEVDGSQDELAVAARVENQFRPFLPTWLY